MIITAMHVHRSGVNHRHFLYEPVDISKKFAQLSTRVHRHGARIISQLFHFGVQGKSNCREDLTPLWGFSGTASIEGEPSHEMTGAEVEEVIQSFVDTAVVAVENGIDGVELHGTHGYLLQQSFGPFANKRTDKWGKDLYFASTLARRVREAIGPDAVMGLRISADDCIRPQDGDCDLVGITRAQIADPDLVHKLQSGQGNRIRLCTGSNQGCIDRAVDYPITCFQNPETGYEWKLKPLAKVATPKRVLVVGGGPAGMKAAELAADLGIESDDSIPVLSSDAAAEGFYDGMKFDIQGTRSLFVDRRGNYETALVIESLARKGSKVTLVTPFLHFGANVGFTHFNDLLNLLPELSCELRASTVIEAIRDGKAHCRHVFSKEPSIEEFDFIVAGVNPRPNKGLHEVLATRVPVFLAGDVVAPRSALEAFHEGDRIGRTV